MSHTLRNRTLAFLTAAFALLAVVVTHPQRDASASASIPGYGWLAGKSSTTAVGGIGAAEVTIYPLTTTFAVNQGSSGATSRMVKVTGVIRVQTDVPATTANGYIDVYLNCGGCQAPIRVAASNTYLPQTGGAGSETMVITGYVQLGLGSYVAEVNVKRSVGSGTISVSQTSGAPQQLWVEDMGL